MLIMRGIIVGVVVMTVLVSLMFGVISAGAWFAFDPLPPFPWPLFKFFLFIGWVIGGVAGAFDGAAQARG